MRIGRVAGVLLAALAALTGVSAQVSTVQKDLKVQTVWENVWGIVQVVFLPGGRVLTVHKTGELHVYDSIRRKANEYRKILDIKDEVYSWWDHGLVSAALHPEFPRQPYLYIAYSAEYPGKPWGDQCYPDPKKEYMTSPPDTRPYCKSMAKIVRLRVDSDFTRADRDGVLFEDWCTSTYTHHVGTIQFLSDGSMLYGAGDGSHFLGIDTGMVQDECTDPNGPKDQGVFTSQKDQYLRGKFIKIAPAALLKDTKATGKLQKDVDYIVLSKGARNPFRSTVDPKSGDVYFGDVGSSVWEEINRIPNPLTDRSKPNFGWPCVEGRDAVSDLYQNWLRQNNLMSTCSQVYQGNFNKPVFQYRYGATDPDFPDACKDADASVSGITFYTGAKLPGRYQGKLMFVDYSKKCGFWFEQGADGKPDFSHAHAFLVGTKGGTPGGMTDVKTGSDGYLYIADYAGGKLYRILDANDDTQDPGAQGGGQQGGDAGSADALGLWLETTPGPYEWKYGDKITYKLHSKKALKPEQVQWRVTNGHCVRNACTGEDDCHFHEISLPAESQTGLSGFFSPSPHPMESFIVITASITEGDDTISKDFITHARTYNYKVTSEPPGFQILLEERTCDEQPCIIQQMAGTNTGFGVQAVNAVGQQLYKFVGWSARDVASKKLEAVNATFFEELSAGDTEAVANFVPVAATLDRLMTSPTLTGVEPDYQSATVKWTAPAEGGPDFVLISMQGPDGEVISRVAASHLQKEVVMLPAAVNRYSTTLSFFDSARARKSMASRATTFSTLATMSQAAKEANLCPGSDLTEVIQRPAGGKANGGQYGLALIGNYPTWLQQGQQVKVTTDVISSTNAQLMVNILQEGSYEWVGGTVVPVPAGQSGLMSLSFDITNAPVDGGDYFIHALLLKDAKKYDDFFVEDKSTRRIVGVFAPKQGAAEVQP